VSRSFVRISKKRRQKTYYGSNRRSDFDLNDLIRHSRRARRWKMFRALWRTPLESVRFSSQTIRRVARRNKPQFRLILLFVLVIGASAFSAVSEGKYNITCDVANVIDGDTFDCDGERIRLAGIDAPEMPGHCRKGRRCTPGDPYASQRYLYRLATGHIECRRVDTDKYGRTVARCRADGEDLSCAMIASGHAVRRYGFIICL
jgi:endonuclease YncB( thermonuclease family)